MFEVLLVTIVYSFAIGSIVLLWGVTAKNHETVSSMAAPILYGFSFLGGSFIAKDGLPDSLKIVQELIPNGKAINSYVSVTQRCRSERYCGGFGRTCRHRRRVFMFDRLGV
ncbi:ABC transporter permease [Bacillus velezensis]|uniref:ABC transporter permease n=1 Tax=Bacillus velezensis TaxID=492670 RepID=UPI0022DD32A2|nr:ABC transporter permease [Bacillus velezensis]WBL39580.1 ABC transporter permease [Bacillus velezensis]